MIHVILVNNNNNDIFQSLAFEIHGGDIHSSAIDILYAVSGRSTAVTGDPRDTSFLWQRIAVLLQCYNLIMISETFADLDETPDL